MIIVEILNTGATTKSYSKTNLHQSYHVKCFSKMVSCFIALQASLQKDILNNSNNLKCLF